jgi:hypothetical protein
MAQQTINIGSNVNAGDGDPLRTAFDKINDNFTELYERAENTDGQTLTLVGNTLTISGGNSVDLNISPAGDLTGSVFADDSTLLVDGVNASIPYSVLSGAPSFGNWTFGSNVLSENSTGNAVIQSSDFAGSKLILRARGPSDQDWTFDQDGELTFPDSTVQNTAYPGIVSTHSGQDRIEVGGTPATMDGLSVRIVSSAPGANEVEINYQPAGTEAIGVNRYGTNVFNGIEIVSNGNTTWFNIDSFDTIGDGTEFTVTDYSGKIYRVNVIMANITTTSPTVVTGDAYCVIERLK